MSGAHRGNDHVGPHRRPDGHRLDPRIVPPLGGGHADRWTHLEGSIDHEFDTIRAAIERRPFKPFSIHTGAGGEYPAAHPENILASPRFDTVFLRHDDARTAIIDLDSITELTYSAPLRQAD